MKDLKLKKMFKGEEMKKEDKELKTMNVNFRCEKSLYERFLKVAKYNDRTGAQLFREFVKDYLSKNAQTKMNFD